MHQEKRLLRKRWIKPSKGSCEPMVLSILIVWQATLYNNRELRERIESLRQQQAEAPTPKQIKREIDENNKDAVIASLKRKIKRLEEEKKQLREQLKVAYAEVYRKI